MEKNIFVIIVTFNGEQWLHKNLQALRESNYPVKTIVIDNCSTDNSVAIIKSYPEIDFIASSSNLGFGKANNIAIQKALDRQADYLFLLNQDAWIFPNTIERLIKVAEHNSTFGIISPVHFSGDAIAIDENFAMFWSRKMQTISDEVDEVPFVNAAAWLVPSQVFKKVGVFESLFSHYGEDRNFTNRTKFHNYKTVVVKNAKICHDRIITRDFNKDIVQSKFQMLNQVLDVNDSLFLGYLKAFQSVIGLPKYFFKSYGVKLSFKLFSILMMYFMRLKLMVFTVIKKRNSYK